MKTSIIVAASENNVIGANGTIPWRLPDDMAFFKRTTMGHHVVMGRKTWESIGRPLPGRTVSVISRTITGALPEGVTQSRVSNAIDPPVTVIGIPPNITEMFIAGGAEIYALALPTVDRIYLTRVHAHIPGDVYIPEIDWTQWIETSRDHHPSDARHAHSFSFIIYERKPT